MIHESEASIPFMLRCVLSRISSAAIHRNRFDLGGWILLIVLQSWLHSRACSQVKDCVRLRI